MAISKVILNDQTLMDVTSDTVTAATLQSGETATASSGEKITGSLIPGGGGSSDYDYHAIDITLVSTTTMAAILGQYVDTSKLVAYRIYPTEADNTSLNTFCIGYGSSAFPAVTAANGVSYPQTYTQYYVNDQTYNVFRGRGNVNNKPAGKYKLEVYGKLL